MEILPWLFRVLVILMILRLARGIWTAGRTPARPARPGSSPNQSVERVGGQLVRDPQCGTYIPQNNAVHLPSGRETLFFCSPACRDAYRAAQSSVA